MKKKWRIIPIVVILLILLGRIGYVIWFNNLSDCEKEYRDCLNSQRRGANIICSHRC